MHSFDVAASSRMAPATDTRLRHERFLCDDTFRQPALITWFSVLICVIVVSYQPSCSCGSMLRCPPSRVKLTSSDIDDLDRRFNARQYARLISKQRSDLRLSPGPGYQTRLAIVSQDDNAGKIRAMSSSSQVTVCSVDDENTGEIPITFVSSPSTSRITGALSNAQSKVADQSLLCSEADKVSKSVLVQRSSPVKRSSGAQGGQPQSAELVSAVVVDCRAVAKTSAQVTTLTIRGAGDDLPTALVPAESPHARVDRADLPVSDEIRDEADPVSSSSRVDPRLLSSARARRRHARSNDERIAFELGKRIPHTQARRYEELDAHRGRTLSPPISDITTAGDRDETQDNTNAVLDPGAPVFVPRTRFGTTTESSVDDEVHINDRELRWSSLDSLHSSGNLRIRPSSEQNIDPAFRQHRIDRHSRASENTQGRQRRSSRVSDQPSALPEPTPNLERYPLLRPPTRPADRHPNASISRPVPIPATRSTRSPPAASASVRPVTDREGQSDHVGNQQGELRSLDGTADGSASPRSTSPARATTSSHTASNMQQPPHPAPVIKARSSSLSWSCAVTLDGQRIPSMVSAASGISDAISGSRRSSAQNLDAATEFLRFRSSPLDDLTERLSRLSGRPRSVGHSWERPTASRARVSLLAGDPFRPEPPPSSPSGFVASMLNESAGEVATPAPQNEHPVASPSSHWESDTTGPLPIAASSPALPSTPPIRSPGTSVGPRLPLADISPDKTRRSPESALKRKPVPTATATPKVRVYDDTEPPHTQPQTLADIGRSSRRTRGRSETAARPSPDHHGRDTVGMGPLVTERHPHRNTYPSATPLRTTAAAPVITPAAPPAAVRRSDSQRGSHESENDVEEQFDGIEQDRRTWLSRQGQGSLETTPPTEGRFERYLS